MLWNWIIDHIPIWVWLVILFGGLGALFYFFSPILVPIWNLMPKWLKVLLGGIVSVTLAALAGRYRGRKDAEEEQRRRDAEALQKRKEVEDAVNKLPPGEAENRLRNRWSSD